MQKDNQQKSICSWWLLLILGIIGMIAASIYTINYVCIPTIKSLVDYKIERKEELFDWKSLPILDYFLSILSLYLAAKTIQFAGWLRADKKEEEEVKFIGASGCGRTQLSYIIDPFSPELRKAICEEVGSNSGLFDLLRRENDNSDNSLPDNEHRLLLEPTISSNQIPSGCSGCRNLHGEVYGGNLLVCVLHPYGQENCPDYK